jgi:hypothetical protein
LKVTRRQFIKGVASAGALVAASRWVGVEHAFSNAGKSHVFKVDECPVHDGQLRHLGLDSLLDLLSENGLDFYDTDAVHPWGSPGGLIASDDVVLIKVNCQWKCRGTTNTVVIFENGQGRGGFDGLSQGGSVYDAWPEIADGIFVNAEAERLLTVDYLVNTVFKHDPVSSYLLDSIRSLFIALDEHDTDGYRQVADVSYPCFTSHDGHRIELQEGIWKGSNHRSNLKLINLPVFKHHSGTGVTGVLKHTYGILSMADGNSGIRHYDESGSQCGKMWCLVKVPDLNILDCIWVSPDSLRGYPQDTTYRADTLLAGIDPVAMDYHASKHVLLPLGGKFESQHNPDTFSGLINHLGGALDFINANGGIGGQDVHLGDENIALFSASAGGSNSGGGSGGGSVGCFITTADS